MRRFLAAAGAAFLLAVGSCGGGSSDTSGDGDATSSTAVEEPSRSTSGNGQTETQYAVGVRRETFVDESRPTGPNPNGGFDGAPERTLPTAIWYPADGEPGEVATDDAPPADGSFPVVLFSHGVDSRGTAYEGLLEQWAAAGFVVAAPDYPLGSADAPGNEPSIEDVDEQARDASFVVDQVLDLDEIGEHVDPERIGAAGHSLGGLTTTGFALSNDFRDERVRSAIVFTVPPQYPGGVVADVPLLLIAGTDDETVPYSLAAGGFESATPPAFFVTLEGAPHSEPYRDQDGERSDVVAATTLDFLDAYLRDDPGAVDALVADGEVPGVASIEVRL